MTWINPFNYTPEQKKISDEIILRTKSIRHLLTPQQKQMYDFLFKDLQKETGYYCSRKIGKTLSLLLMLFEFCWKNENKLCRFVLANQTQAAKVIVPLFNLVIRSLVPPSMLPTYLVQGRTFKFNTGSIIELNGANPDVIESSRGPMCDFFIFDEVASWEGDVEYALLSVFYPQAVLTNAPKVFASSPPRDCNSFYLQQIHPRLVGKNVLISLTIDDNPLLTKENIKEIEISMGGRDSPSFRREYLCETIQNQDLRLVPEFTQKTHVTEEFIKYVEYGDHRVSELYQYFISTDTGVVDNTAVLIGYFDHCNQTLNIEDEFVDNNINSKKITTEIQYLQDKYQPWFYHPTKGIKQILDAFELTRKDFKEIYGINSQRPIKYKIEDNVSKLRTGFQNNKILISKKCKRLIWELENCIWDEKSITKKIANNAEQKHGDSIMALVYMFNAVNWRFKPYQNANITDLFKPIYKASA